MHRSRTVLNTEEEDPEDERLVGNFTIRSIDSVPPPSPTSVPPSPIHSKYRAIWRRAMFKIKAQKAINKVNVEILVYGTNNELTDLNMQYKANIDELIATKRRKDEKFRKLSTEAYYSANVKTWLLTPNSRFKKCWNLLLVLLLTYTALVMPFRIAFYDVVFWDAWTILDFAIDGLFFLDICINFISVQVKSDGSLEIRHGKIVKSYLKGWFVLDLAACMPFSLLDMFQSTSADNSANKYNNMLRLARLPRLYKLFRITRIIQAFRYYRATNITEKIQDFLQINSRLYKLVKFLLSVFVCVHVAGCFWYFSARASGFEPDTWVTRTTLPSEDLWTRYLFSVYWAITTCVTVGYGDITAKTWLEMVMAMGWMLAGVGFYSFTVGSLSSFLTSIDTRESILASKMAAIQEFSQEAGLSNDCKIRIRSAIRYNTFKVGNVWRDKHSLFRELPKELRYEVAVSMYGGIARKFPLFAGKDPAFINFVMPLFQPLRMQNGQYVFKEGDRADEVYLITSGRVNFIVRYAELVYKSFLKGSIVGDVEVFRQIRRVTNAVCFGNCEFLVLTARDLDEIIHEFPSEGRQLLSIAKEKARRIKQAYVDSLSLLRLRKGFAVAPDQTGHEKLLDLDDVEEKQREGEYEKYLQSLGTVELEIREAKARLVGITRSLTAMHTSMSTLVKRLNAADISFDMSAGMLGRLLIRKNIAS